MKNKEVILSKYLFDDFFFSTPSLSPNKDMVAYVEHFHADSSIITASIVGAREFRLTAPELQFRDPDWSPDGEQLAISNGWNIFVMDADGSNIVQITPGQSGHVSPSWSPDGQRICFTASETGHNIHAVNVDGTNHIRVTNLPGDEEYPDWSPDGDFVAFAAHPGIFEGAWDIFIVNIHTFEVTRLTDDQTQNIRPCWSPDSSRIAFARDGVLSVMDRDGSNFMTIPGIKFSNGLDWR